MVNKNAIFVIAVASLFMLCTIAAVPDSESAVSQEKQTVQLKLSIDPSDGTGFILYDNGTGRGERIGIFNTANDPNCEIGISAQSYDPSAKGWYFPDAGIYVKTTESTSPMNEVYFDIPSSYLQSNKIYMELWVDTGGNVDPVSVAIVGITAIVGIAAVALVIGKN